MKKKLSGEKINAQKSHHRSVTRVTLQLTFPYTSAMLQLSSLEFKDETVLSHSQTFRV